MAQLFPKWTNKIPLILGIGVPLALVAVVGFVWYYFSPKYTDVGYMPKQPVSYSHQLHAGQMGIDCRYCHNTVEKADFAAIPPTQTCMGCHNHVQQKSPQIKIVKAAYEENKPLEWQKVHLLPDYAHFPHRAHVNVGVGCVSCHGRIDQMPVVYQSQPLSMSWCLECHRDPLPNLRPTNQVTNMSMTPRLKITIRGKMLAAHTGLIRRSIVRVATIKYFTEGKKTMTQSSSMDEFPSGASELEIEADGVGRRKFLGLMSASMALAGVSLTGCIRKPAQKILPYTMRPEDIIPGKSLNFATTIRAGSSVLGVLVKSTDGRPTKVDGNPLHPSSLGGSNIWAQASVLDVYDNDRSQHPKYQGKDSTLPAAEDALKALAAEARKNQGEGFAILIEPISSPSLFSVLTEFKNTFPKAQIFYDDSSVPQNSRVASIALGAGPASICYALNKAQVIASFDADLFGLEGDTEQNQRHYADGRRLSEHSTTMNRLYVVEPTLTVFGMNAEHRLAVPASHVGEFLVALGEALSKNGVALPSVFANATAKSELIEKNRKWNRYTCKRSCGKPWRRRYCSG